MSKYNDIDELIYEFEAGKVSLEDYVNEYNRLIKQESERRMKYEKPGDREDI